MLEKEKSLDCIVISTPDHIHAAAGVMAMKLGKHVYTEKPMAHTVYEVRVMTETAAKQKVQTQMGTQIHAGDNYRRVVELVQSGAIGKVTDVHVWLGATQWTASGQPKDGGPTPAGLHWDLWVGPRRSGRTATGTIRSSGAVTGTSAAAISRTWAATSSTSCSGR